MGHYTTIVSQGAPGKVFKDTAFGAPVEVIKYTIIFTTQEHESLLPHYLMGDLISSALYFTQSSPDFISTDMS